MPASDEAQQSHSTTVERQTCSLPPDGETSRSDHTEESRAQVYSHRSS